MSMSKEPQENPMATGTSDVEDEDDGEAPEEISFQITKSLIEEEASLVKSQKLNEKRVLKLKRQMRHELNRAQKLEKKKRLELEAEEPLFSPELVDQLRQESQSQSSLPSDATAAAPEDPATATTAEPPSKKSTKRSTSTKTFPDLNIQVCTLESIQNSRGSTASSFKTQRLAKAHREHAGVGEIVGSYKEKLRASGRLRN